MERRGETEAAASAYRPGEWTKLIRKLPWIGMEDEARSLERAVCSRAPAVRDTVSAGPFSTD
jgi:hypothetical protein